MLIMSMDMQVKMRNMYVSSTCESSSFIEWMMINLVYFWGGGIL